MSHNQASDPSPAHTLSPARTILRAALLTAIPPVAVGLAEVIADVAEHNGRPLTATGKFLARIVMLLVSIGIGTLIARHLGGLRQIGWRPLEAGSLRRVWWFLPVLAVEGAYFVTAVDPHAAGVPVLLLALFALLVGIHEELYYRGLIIQMLRRFEWRTLALVACALFALPHLSNLAAGASVGYTALQVAYAFLFGLVALEIVTLTGSLWPAMVWHAVHDAIANMTGSELTGAAAVAVGVQVGVMALTALLWWRPAQRRFATVSS